MSDSQKAPDSSAVRLTDERASRLPIPSHGRKYYTDAETRGFCVCVTARGTRTFYVYRKVQGRPEHIRIGQWPDWKVKDARVRAAVINRAIDSGANPNDLKRQQRAEMTLEALYEIYYE